MGCKCMSNQTEASYNNDINVEKLSSNQDDLINKNPPKKYLGKSFSIKSDLLGGVQIDGIPIINNFNINNQKSNPARSKDCISEISSKNETYNKNYSVADSSTKGNSIKTTQFYESLKMNLLYKINEIRTNPHSLINLINKYISQIYIHNNQPYLIADKNNHIKLFQGKNMFDNCIKFLQKQKSLPVLMLKEELSLPFPESNISDCVREQYLTPILQQKKETLIKRNINMINFHYDIMVPEPELSVMLQVVDDTNSLYQRRMNIFNEDAQYIGITIGKIRNDLFCFYFAFGKDNEEE